MPSALLLQIVGCYDDYQHRYDCPHYVRNGDCENDEHADWMDEHCRKSCGLCRGKL